MMVIKEVNPENRLKRSRLDVRKFSNRIVDYMWNSLSHSFFTANCATLNNFKRHFLELKLET